jgi:two-component system, NarL family, response regulator YdfI
LIRVLIAASSAIARAGLESLLRDAANIEVIGAASNWEQLGSEEADVILANWDDDAPADLLDRGRAAIVLLTEDPQPSTTLDLLRAGARAVLNRDSSGPQIAAAIEAAAAGLVALRPEDIEPWLGSPRPAGLSEPLTPRETEVLGMMAEGLANKVIAHRLGISEHTVKFHVTSVMAKLNAASRTEAVMLGVRQGLILL